MGLQGRYSYGGDMWALGKKLCFLTLSLKTRYDVVNEGESQAVLGFRVA